MEGKKLMKIAGPAFKRTKLKCGKVYFETKRFVRDNNSLSVSLAVGLSSSGYEIRVRSTKYEVRTSTMRFVVRYEYYYIFSVFPSFRSQLLIKSYCVEFPHLECPKT